MKWKHAFQKFTDITKIIKSSIISWCFSQNMSSVNILFFSFYRHIWLLCIWCDSSNHYLCTCFSVLDGLLSIFQEFSHTTVFKHYTECKVWKMNNNNNNKKSFNKWQFRQKYLYKRWEENGQTGLNWQGVYVNSNNRSLHLCSDENRLRNDNTGYDNRSPHRYGGYRFITTAQGKI